VLVVVSVADFLHAKLINKTARGKILSLINFIVEGFAYLTKYACLTFGHLEKFNNFLFHDLVPSRPH